jgi:cell division protein FtsB
VNSKLSKIAMALLRRGLSVIFIVLLCFTLLAVSEWTIDPHLRAKNARFQTQLSQIQFRVETLKSQAQDLRNEVARLQADDNEILYHARNGLGMVRPGEVIYRFDPRSETEEDERR